jgi:site-specific DNA recombinase
MNYLQVVRKMSIPNSQFNEVVIIARVSTKGQEGEGYSLESQVKSMTAYCLSNNLTIKHVFKIAETAGKAEQRKIFQEAMKYIADNNIKNLIVEKVDRHVRNLHDAVETHDWLMADEDRRVHFVKDSLVMHKNSRSQEWLNWGIRVVMAKNYIDNLREEAMKGWAEKLAQGWLPSVPPPGYKTITEAGKRIHVPDPDTRYLIVKLFRFYLQAGESVLSTAKEMERLGIRTRKGRPYAKSKVQKMLLNPFYIGINHFDGKNYPGAQEAIIPKQLFELVQQKLHRGRPQSYGRHHSPLQSLIRCSDCGSVVTWQLQKGHYYGVCRRLTPACKQGKMLREDHVEDMIKDQLKALTCPAPEIIDWVLSEMRLKHHSEVEEREVQRKSIEGQIARVQRMDEMLYDDKLAGTIIQERYEVKHEQFVSEISILTERLAKLDELLSLRLVQRIGILELTQKASEIYDSKPPEQKRLIISKLFSELYLQGGTVSVKYTKFVEMIAENLFKTRKLLEGEI